MTTTYNPAVYLDANRRPLLVFRKGRVKYHAIAVEDKTITVTTLDTLRGLVEATRMGEPYPAKRAASFWLNHDHRPCTKRAKQVLRGLVARKPRAHEVA
jgi:hypothetical protein